MAGGGTMLRDDFEIMTRGVTARLALTRDPTRAAASRQGERPRRPDMPAAPGDGQGGERKAKGQDAS